MTPTTVAFFAGLIVGTPGGLMLAAVMVKRRIADTEAERDAYLLALLTRRKREMDEAVSWAERAEMGAER
jgi:hypothetical protein